MTIFLFVKHKVALQNQVKKVVAGFFGNCTKPNYNAYWERTEAIPGTKETLADFTKFIVLRENNNRSLNGTFVYRVDFDNTYKCKLKTAYSPYGNSQFINQPYQVEPMPLCDFYKNSYKRYGEPMFINKSNFPIIPPEGLCPIPKGEYYVRNANLMYENFPMQAPKGLWRIELYYINPNNENVGGYHLFLKFE